MFGFYMPTHIYAGENAVKNNPDALVLGKRAFIITGRTSGRKSGALDDVLEVLRERNITYAIYDAIENNPSLECVYHAGGIAKSFGADFIIGIGGGSPLDSAKAAAVYAVNNIKPMDIYGSSYKNKPLPIAAIPTTAGTGSEVTPYSILTLHDMKTKKSFSSPDCFCKSAFLDGRYTLNLPLNVARNTAVDALCHAIEGYVNTRSSPSSDYIALEAMRLIGECKDVLLSGNFDIETCQKLLWASALGGIVISQTGTTIVHSMGYQLTYFRNIPHGMANGMLIGGFLEYSKEKIAEKLERIFNAMRLDGPEEFNDLMRRLLPHDMRFSEAEIKKWAAISIKAKNAATAPKSVTEQDEADIMTACLCGRS